MAHETWGRLVDKNNWKIEFVSAPELIYKVYTPIPGWEPRTSFFSPYREYTLFKSMAANNVVVTKEVLNTQLKNSNLLTYDMPEYEINSGDISLTYFPNSVFIYIKQSENERYGSFENRIVEMDTCSKITGISVTYHNNTTIGQSSRLTTSTRSLSEMVSRKEFLSTTTSLRLTMLPTVSTLTNQILITPMVLTSVVLAWWLVSTLVWISTLAICLVA